MRVQFLILILFFTSWFGVFSKSQVATKEDINRLESRIDKKFEMLIHQIDKRFEQVDKRFEMLIHQIDKRFETLNLYFMIAAAVIGFLFIRVWLISDKLTKAISRLEASISTLSQAKNPNLDINQIITVLETADEKSKQRFREILKS